MYKTGDVILAQVQFTDTFEIKTMPAVVLFEEYGNIVVAGITSNTKMDGVPLTKKEGAFKNSIIKLNYIFTISDKIIKKKLFLLSEEKKKVLVNELINKFKQHSTKN